MDMQVQLLMLLEGWEIQKIASATADLLFYKHEQSLEIYAPINDDEFINTMCNCLLEDFEEIRKIAKQIIETKTFNTLGDYREVINIIEQLKVKDSYERIKRMYELFLFIIGTDKKYPAFIHFIMLVPILTHYLQKHKEKSNFLTV